MSERLKRAAVFVLVAAVALSAGLYFGHSSSPKTPETRAEDLLAASGFVDLQGQPRRISDWQGQARIINFWATWCAPCLEEMPLLNEFQRQQAEKGVQVLGIALDSAENVAKFRKKLKIEFPLLLGDPNTLSLLKSLGNSAGGLPFSVFIDRNGRIVGSHLGPLDRAQLLDALRNMEAYAGKNS